MGGLGTALAFAKKGFKKIDVFETASNLGFVGAGIQMPPNVARVLDRLGCWNEIESEATNVTDTSIRRKTMPSSSRGLAEKDAPLIHRRGKHECRTLTCQHA